MVLWLSETREHDDFVWMTLKHCLDHVHPKAYIMLWITIFPIPTTGQEEHMKFKFGI